VTEPLEQWLAKERRHAAAEMLRCLSARDVVKVRPGLRQTVRPVAGSIVASRMLGDWNPDPDYFFHWFRDSAIVIDAVRLLYETGELGSEALTHFSDFVQFSLSLGKLDGRALTTSVRWRENVAPDFVQFLRGEELAAVSGDAVYADTRVNPDGTLDVLRWNRPQHDGSALRALAVLRWLRTLAAGTPGAVGASALADAERLLRVDLAFIAARWRAPSYDIWEDELGHDYFTLRVSAAALRLGADWLGGTGDVESAAKSRDDARALLDWLDRFWLADPGCYRSRIMPPGVSSTRMLDVSVILSVLHARDGSDVHSARDPRMQATLDRLEQLFDKLYPINHGRPRERAPAIGRFADDTYFSGGAWYAATLGAAEFCFLAADSPTPVGDERSRWVARGDAFLTTVRAFTPPSGDLSEQFDRHTGAQTSAKHLAWSYASFISCMTARRAVVSA
jgi:GH15 family glucan-1,4-alpha-glucosidase